MEMEITEQGITGANSVDQEQQAGQQQQQQQHGQSNGGYFL